MIVPVMSEEGYFISNTTFIGAIVFNPSAVVFAITSYETEEYRLPVLFITSTLIVSTTPSI
jgi:hypothetical protein